MSNRDSEPDWDDAGQLSLELGQRLVDALNEKLKDRKCEVCGEDSFSINSALATPRFLRVEKDKVVGFQPNMIHECAVSHCNNCGNTKLHSLQILGFDLRKGVEE